MTDPLVSVLALTPLPGAKRTLGQGLTEQQIAVLAAAVRDVIARPVVALHQPCHTPDASLAPYESGDACLTPYEHRPGDSAPVCSTCVDQDLQTFAHPCPTLRALLGAS